MAACVICSEVAANVKLPRRETSRKLRRRAAENSIKIIYDIIKKISLQAGCTGVKKRPLVGSSCGRDH
jgi:hypothetical protein